MGNGTAKIAHCFSGAGTNSSGQDMEVVVFSDEGLGHSFCYVRPNEKKRSFKGISGASLSANNSTALSTEVCSEQAVALDHAASFESSTLFASVPLQRSGFLIGRSEEPKKKKKKRSLLEIVKRAIYFNTATPAPAPADDDDDNSKSAVTTETSSGGIEEDSNNKDVEWAQGKAGEDRVHVVISEEHGWVFVGIYDGFNGPDAPDFLLSHLYHAVHRRLLLAQTDCHSQVLEALSDAVRRTEDAFLAAADQTMHANPELALMGSCVLLMLMNGDHLYLLNVGDSRAVLARAHDPDPLSHVLPLQLTMDHSTYVSQEVERIRKEHPDDASAVVNERVKGYLKVTRAFGAGFLKQSKWNDGLLEMFRIEYVGNGPYLTCEPWTQHYELTSKDRFLILSSDGLYQYFSNQQAVAEVDLFIASFPDGDPAQHLVEQVLFRAAKKAGMDFHELLDIPQGERRRYHDDISVIVISFQGTIWRSSM